MSKKDNLKFKKRIKSQILQEISHAQEDKLPKNEKILTNLNTVATAPKNTIDKIAPDVVLEDDNTRLVKTDLKKSGIIIGSIVILIVATYFIDHKTGFLLKAGSSLFSFLHISA